MGYRSEVECLIYAEPKEMDAFIVKHKLLGSSVFERFSKDISYHENIVKKYKGNDANGENVYEDKPLKIMRLYGDHWKWYDDYDDVKAWHALMDEAVEAGLCVEFARVGEEMDDNTYEAHGDHEYYLEIHRSTSSPFH